MEIRIMGLKDIHKKAEDIWEKLRLRTHILAIKLLRDVNNIPKGAKRPIKDLGYHLDLCQGFAMSRWAGETIAMLKEDMWCFEPVVGFGLAEAPEIFLQGNNRFPASAMNQNAGKKWAQSFPHIKLAKYIGIISAPLNQCSFKPDMFIIYCDPSQLTQLLIAKECIDGISVNCTLSGHAACVYAFAPVLQNQQCIVLSPYLEDRYTSRLKNNKKILKEFFCHFSFYEK